MSILGSIYGTVIYVRNALYDSGVYKSHELQGPVVSIGNLSVGGSGKTPFTILLGELLKAKQIKFDVLSRGYCRDTSDVLLVDPAGSPQQFGDEPLLIARKLQVQVIVGKSRYQAGVFAEQKFGPQLHILDDGFQHRSLARDFDIVLVSSNDLKDRFLPIGRLREPLSSLKRASALATSDDLVVQSPSQSDKSIWKINRGIAIDAPPSRPIVFCGIARPALFLSQVHGAGIEISGEMIFRDHHRYTQRDIESLQKLRLQERADGFITTEKDAINLGDQLRALEPATIAKVTMELENPANAIDAMLRIISMRSASHEKILSNS